MHRLSVVACLALFVGAASSGRVVWPPARDYAGKDGPPARPVSAPNTAGLAVGYFGWRRKRLGSGWPPLKGLSHPARGNRYSGRGFCPPALRTPCSDFGGFGPRTVLAAGPHASVLRRSATPPGLRPLRAEYRLASRPPVPHILLRPGVCVRASMPAFFQYFCRPGPGRTRSSFFDSARRTERLASCSRGGGASCPAPVALKAGCLVPSWWAGHTSIRLGRKGFRPPG
jgi:hypothetical protein